MIQSKFFQKLIIVSIIGVVAFMAIGLFSSLFINKLLEEKNDSFNVPKRKVALIKLSLLNMDIKIRESFIKSLNKEGLEDYKLVNSSELFECKSIDCSFIKVDEHHILIMRRNSRLLSRSLIEDRPPKRGPPPNTKFQPRENHSGKKSPKEIETLSDNRLLMTVGVQFVAMIFYITILILLIFYYSKKRREVGEEVFEKIRQGNLDARFPTSKVDDFGTNTRLFNQMADEIMHLVLKLEKKDESRKLLFKTLAHDLKTPAASLKGIMETLTLRKNELSESQKSELYKMSNNEIDYFSSLLDDILFLAKVQDPEFKTSSGKTEIVSSLKDLCDSISFINKSIDISFLSDIEEYDVNIEYNSLMRLFRNALDNALLYGKSKVTVQIRMKEFLEVLVINDGKGFDDNTIQSFGTFKTSRTRDNSQGSLSFGLGSVIMSSIVESVNGSITPLNKLSSDGEILGAMLVIKFPLS